MHLDCANLDRHIRQIYHGSNTKNVWRKLNKQQEIERILHLVNLLSFRHVERTSIKDTRRYYISRAVALDPAVAIVFGHYLTRFMVAAVELPFIFVSISIH